MKKLRSPKKLTAIIVLSIFVLSGLLGGAFAPIISSLIANSSGTQNKVVSNYYITGLPRENILVGTKIADTTKGGGIPTLVNVDGGAGVIAPAPGQTRLFRRVNTAWVEILRANWGGNNAYDRVVGYEWRFYNLDVDSVAISDTTKALSSANRDRYFYKHPVQIYQENYEITFPTSARDSDGTLNFIPNVSIPNKSITVPVLDTFVDRKANDLFDDETKDVKDLRNTVLVELGGDFANPSKYLDTPTKAKTEYLALNKFKEAIFENTIVSMVGTDELPNEAIKSGTTKYTQAEKDGMDEIQYKNLMVKGARTFIPTTPGEFTAEYIFDPAGKTSIKAKKESSPISVERIRNVDSEYIMGGGTTAQNKANQIRFEIPPAVESYSNLTINQEFKFPLPTVSLSRETSTDSDAWNPVRFSRETSVTAYTYIEVLHYGLDTKPVDYYDNDHPMRIDEKTNYKFTPEWPGVYSFVYYTTTHLGAGYTDLYGANAVETHKDTDTGITYFVYLPNEVKFITSNEIIPEIKWSVPYKYAEADSGSIKKGDAIPIDDYSALFGVDSNTVLQRYAEGRFFSEAPDLINYMPTSGTSADDNITQVLGEGAGATLVLPALLGQNNIAHADKLKYYLTLSRMNGGIPEETLTFSTDTSIVSYRYYDPKKPFVIEFGADRTYASVTGDSPTGYAHLGDWKKSESGQLFKGMASADRFSRFRIEVYALDNTDQQFIIPNSQNPGDKQWGKSSDSQRFSFNVVRAANYQMNKETVRPSFSGLNLDKKSYYEDDAISFLKVNTADDFTLSTQIDVKYYLAFDGKVIEIDDTYINKSTQMVVFDLSKENQKYLQNVQPSLTASDGVLPMKVVAVARNYYALTTSQTSFKPGATYIGETEILKYLDGTLDNTDAKMRGVAIEAFPIKMYDWKYGANAVIGLKGATGDVAHTPSMTNAELTRVWREAFIATEDDNGDPLGNASGYTDSNVSNVKQGKVINIPDFTVGYLGSDPHFYGTVDVYPEKEEFWECLTCGEDGLTEGDTCNCVDPQVPDWVAYWECTVCHGRYDTADEPCLDNPTQEIVYNKSGFATTIEIGVITPVSKEPDGIVNYTIPVNSERSLVSDLKYHAKQIGLHTVVCAVYNTGNFVSVFTATFNVVGTPDVYPVFNGGRPTGRVGQQIDLPWVSLRVGGYQFETSFETYTGIDDVMKIRAAFKPDQAQNPTTNNIEPWNPAWDKDPYNMLTVGYYSISGIEITNNAVVSSGLGGSFIPTRPGTYVFTYTFHLDSKKLQGLLISAIDGMKAPSRTYTITVAELNEGDLDIQLDAEGYRALRGTDEFYDAATDTNVDPAAMATDPRYSGISGNNILTQMLSRQNFSMSTSQLSSGMIPVYKVDSDGNLVLSGGKAVQETRPDKADDQLWQYGRIYLPNFDVVWKNGLKGFAIDTPSVSSVTVNHKDRPDIEDALFNSHNIDKGTQNEKKYVETTSGERFYYFQPGGTAYVDKKYSAAERYEAGDPAGSARPDGIYVVTYMVEFQNLSIPMIFEISIGDVARPTIYLLDGEEDKLFGKEWAKGDVFTVKIQDSIRVDANNGRITERGTGPDLANYANWYVARNLEVQVQLPVSAGGAWMTVGAGDDKIQVNPSRSEDSTIYAEYDSDGKLINNAPRANRTWSFKFTQEGDYKIRFTISSATGQKDTFERTVNIPTPGDLTKFNGSLFWGIILIVLSVGLLLGVVVYFIQTGRTTKFAAAGGSTTGLRAKKAKAPAAEAPPPAADATPEPPTKK